MLLLRLKKIFFEKIKSGEKTHEYREYKDYWKVRIANEIAKNNKDIKFDIKFVCGYLDKDPSKILFAKVVDISLINGKNTDLKTDKTVFDIEFVLDKRGTAWDK